MAAGMDNGVDPRWRGSPVEWTHDGGCSRFGGFGRIVFNLGDLGCGHWVADG